MSSLYRRHSIDASYQVSVYLVKLFQRRTFLEIDQSETRIACAAKFLPNQAEMSNLYRGLYIDASYHVSVDLP